MNTDKIYAEKIAEEYAPRSTSKAVALKKLDAKAKLPSEIFAYTCGIASTLVFGTGMCLAMQVIGAGNAASVALGIAVGVIGMLGIAVNYPVYKKLRRAGMKKYSYEIMRLAKEISDEAEM